MTKPNMSQVFADFWRINIGQVATVCVFLVGIGITWANTQASIREVDYRATTRIEGLERAQQVTLPLVAERAQVEHRLSSLEKGHESFAALTVAMATVTAELRLTREQLAALQQDIKRLEQK